MRKKIITMAVTLLLLGLLSAVEQMAVKRLTDDAMARTQEILSLLAQNQTARGLERAHEMDAWWDEEAPRVETLINHEATDDVLDDIEVVLGKLMEAGFEHVIAVDLTRPELDVPAVRMVIPGMEVWTMDGDREGPRLRGMWPPQ